MNQTSERVNPPDMAVCIQPGATEFDVLNKTAAKAADSVFLKLYVSLRTSGLLSVLSDKDFKTLIAVALFMDKNGYCYPSERQIGEVLGVKQPGASKRVGSLLAFRWQGKPLITKVRERLPTGKWGNNRYTILPHNGLSIFDQDPSSAFFPIERIQDMSEGEAATLYRKYAPYNN